MEPKEKAAFLIFIFGKCINNLNMSYQQAKECALISVDEILNIENIKPYILHKEIIEYWENVKQEINKL